MYKNRFSKDYVSLKAPCGFGYSGDVNNLKKAGKSALGIGMGAGALYLVIDCGKRFYNYFFGEKEKDAAHRRKMEEKQYDHQARMEEAAQKNMFNQEKMKLEQEHWREKHAKKESSVVESASESSVEDEKVSDGDEPDDSLWLGNFRDSYKMPILLGILGTIMAVCPPGFELAMLLHLLCMSGALCFSKVRAKYLDGNLHAPNLQVIIEGGWGTGKGKFEAIYKLLFARVIDADVEKMNCIDPEDDVHPVVQTVGLGLTRAKYFEVLHATKGLHLYNFSPEILAVNNDLKKQNGLTFEHLRKAFDNSEVYQNNMSKNSKNGYFPVYYNYTFTGTPADTSKFISGELEGGTASRIAWGVIPDTGKEISKLGTIAEPELEKIRDQIDVWRSNYCYQTINGEDVIQPETIIDLGYINDALKIWLDGQYDLSKQEKNPARGDARARMATMAFHFGISIAMYYGNPSAKEHAKRKAVIELTIYIANLCMERFLHKFGDIQNAQRAEAMKAEKVNSGCIGTTSIATEDGISDEVVEKWYHLNTRAEDRLGYKKIAKRYRVSEDTVKNKIRQYKKKHSIE